MPAIRDWINGHDGAIAPHLYQNIKMAVTTQMYTENEGTIGATEILQVIIGRNRGSNIGTSVPRGRARITHANTMTSQELIATAIASKVTHNVALRFTYENFTVDILKSWSEDLKYFQQVALDYNLGSQKKTSVPIQRSGETRKDFS